MTHPLTKFAMGAYGAWHGPDVDLGAMRAGFDVMYPAPPSDVTVEEATVAGVRGRWISAPESGARIHVHVHGGAFMLGSSYGYRDLGARLARATQSRVFLPDYDLAPEVVFPAAFDQVVAVVTELAATGEELVLSGDSAGGNLALAAAVALAADGIRPVAVVLMSPFGDLSLSGDSMTALESLDPISTRAAAEQAIALYLGGADPMDSRASAVFADLSGLPPLLVQVGSHEILLDDAVRITERARAAGVHAELQVSYQLCHVFQAFAYQFPEAQEAIDQVGAFVQARVDGRMGAAR